MSRRSSRTARARSCAWLTSRETSSSTTVAVPAEGGGAAGDDRDAVDGIGARQRERRQRVPHLVDRDDLALPLADDPALSLEARDDPIDGLLQLGHHHGVALAPGGEQRGLVDDVG